MKLSEYSEAAVAEFFEYLDELRESGETNMFGAGPYLREEFGLGRETATSVLIAWQRTFDRDTSPASRAVLAKASGDTP
jgi:hypothetical protein